MRRLAPFILASLLPIAGYALPAQNVRVTGNNPGGADVFVTSNALHGFLSPYSIGASVTNPAYNAITDTYEGKTAQVTPIREMRVVSGHRLVGSTIFLFLMAFGLCHLETLGM